MAIYLQVEDKVYTTGEIITEKVVLKQAASRE